MRRDTRMPDPVYFLGPEERWRVFGAAIVKQACFDWKEAAERLKKPETSTKEMSEQKKSAEHFLRSPLCEMYSGLDGKTLLRKIKDQLKEAV